jgi:hypothetical protein
LRPNREPNNRRTEKQGCGFYTALLKDISTCVVETGIFIIFFRYGSAPSGSGKAHQSVNRAVELVRDRDQRVLFLSPTKELSAKTAAKEVVGRVPYRVINEDTVGKGHVSAELVRPFKAPDEVAAPGLCHPCHHAIPPLHRQQARHACHRGRGDASGAIREPSFANNTSPDYSRAVPLRPLTAKGRNKDNDECLGVIASTIRRLTNPHWHNYVNTEQYERLRRGEIQTLAFHSILAPDIFAGFASVFMTAANFEATALYQLWSDWNGAEDAPLAAPPSFFRDDGFISSLRFQAHQNGELVTIYHGMDATNSKKRLADGGTDTDNRTNRDRLIDTTKGLFGDEPFVWQANKGYDDEPFGANATRLPNVPHGLNDYAAYHNIAFLSAVHPTPDHYRFLASLGLNATTVYDAIYYQLVYQAVMRTALRNPTNRHPIKIFVPDSGAARYLQSVFAGANVVKAESGIVEEVSFKKSGRCRQWQDDAERMRHRRQQARERQIELLNKQARLIRQHMAYDIVVENESNTTPDTSPKMRSETTIGLYTQKRTHLRPGVRGSKNQSEQPHIDVFVDDYRNVECCGTLYRDKQSKEPLAYLKWHDEESYVAVLAEAFIRRLGEKSDNFLISPAVFDPTPISGKQRAEDNVVYCRGVVMDFENGELPPKELPLLFPDIRMVVTNSFSSTKGKPRYRAIVPTNQPMTVEMYRAVYDAIAAKLEDAGYYVGNRKRRGATKPSGLDWSKRNPASPFYLPCRAKANGASFLTYYDDAGSKTLNPVIWITNTIPESEEGPVWDGSKQQEVNHAIVDAALHEWRAGPKGQGNDAFFRLGVNLRKAGLSPAEIRAILMEEEPHARSANDRRAQVNGIMATLFKCLHSFCHTHQNRAGLVRSRREQLFRLAHVVTRITGARSND